MNRMRLSRSKCIILWAPVLALLLPLVSVASESRVSADRSVHVEYNSLGSAGKTLHIETENGDVQCTATDANEIIVDAHILVHGRQIETCEQLADQVRVEVQVVGETIEVVTTKPKKFGYGYSIGYSVRLPKRLGVNAETVNGEVMVLGVEGAITVESVNGNVRAVETKGAIDASTTNGSIYLRQVAAVSIEASTVNGRVDCSCRGTAPDRMDISTVNGSVDIALPSKVDARVTAETVNGGVQVDLGVGKAASKSRGSVELTIGAGNSNYEFSSVNGAISVAVARAD